MLSPEVYNLEAPSVHYSVTKANIKDSRIALTKVQQCQFPHIVSLIVSDIDCVPENLLIPLVADAKYSKILDFSADSLLNLDFLGIFIQPGGRLSLLSVNTRADCDTCLAVTPAGKLILTLEESLFQALNFEALDTYKEIFKKDHRIAISIDLKQRAFTDLRVTYERTLESLQRLPKMTVIFKWEPPSMLRDEVDSLSAANFFHEELGYSVTTLHPSAETLKKNSVHIPLLEYDSCDKDDVAAVIEWMGMVSLNGNLGESSLSSYRVPEPNQPAQNVTVLNFKGLFMPSQLELFFNGIRNFCERESKQAYLFIQPFTDAVVSLTENGKQVHMHGDDSYAFIMDAEHVIICKCQSVEKNYI